ncbi:MAG: MotA/TolQ/ExbB proton channel family protein [Leptotrichiaceae bacterium]|nr:MotA/TolQ/ExbB proton channel family protein [Leptotrichiaceae bacterium]
MNNYELIFRRYGGVTTVVLVIVSVISIAIVINKTRLLYKNESIYKIQDRSFNNLEILLKMKEIELYHNMWVLRFSYLVAPLLGILGTVLGLMNAFSSIETSQVVVSASISQALVTTAIGLVLAMIIHFFYSLFTERIENILDIIELDEKKKERTDIV